MMKNEQKIDKMHETEKNDRQQLKVINREKKVDGSNLNFIQNEKRQTVVERHKQRKKDRRQLKVINGEKKIDRS